MPAERVSVATSSRNLMTVIAVAVLSCSKAVASPQSDFWAWFQKEESKLFSFESDQEAVFSSLDKAMHRVHPDLTFEFGPIENGKREFVISAGGIQSAFPAVESLYRAAPALPHWKWIKFRPRRSELSDIEFQGRTVKADDVRFVLSKDGEKIGITLYFNYYAESKRRRLARSDFCCWTNLLASSPWKRRWAT